MRGWLIGVAVIATLALACDDDGEDEVEASQESSSKTSATEASAPPLAEPRPLVHPAAFELVAVAQGAVLLWGEGGGLRALRLDPRGGPRGEPSALEGAGEPLEVAAAAGGGRLGVAWIAKDGGALLVRAAIGEASGRAFGPPLRLGETTGQDGTQRGWLAVAASDAGSIDALFRSSRGPCGGDHPGERCVRFFHRRLGSEAEPRGLPLVIPEPCARAVVGNAFSDGDWYFGLCARSLEGAHAPETTLYALRFDPEYAHAERVLEGCDPRGLAAVAGGVLAVGDCDGAPHGVRVADAGRHRTELGALDPRVRCEAGRPVVEVAGEGAGFEVRLEGPRSEVQPLLPAAMAPPGARAVWTGEALLVATPLEERVALGRYRCRDGRLAPTGGPPVSGEGGG